MISREICGSFRRAMYKIHFMNYELFFTCATQIDQHCVPSKLYMVRPIVTLLFVVNREIMLNRHSLKSTAMTCLTFGMGNHPWNSCFFVIQPAKNEDKKFSMMVILQILKRKNVRKNVVYRKQCRHYKLFLNSQALIRTQH